MNCSSLSVLSRYQPGNANVHTRPLPVEYFRAAIRAIVAALRALLEDHERVVLVTSMPEAMQVPVGWMLQKQVAEAENGAGSVLDRLYFAAYDQGLRDYAIVYLGEEADPRGLRAYAQARAVVRGIRRWVNLTRHDIVVLDDAASREILRIEPSGTVAILDEVIDRESSIAIDGENYIPTQTVTHSNTIGLEPRRDGVAYVVSRLTALANAGRDDLYFPHEEVRDEQGRILGCRVLAQVAPDKVAKS